MRISKSTAMHCTAAARWLMSAVSDLAAMLAALCALSFNINTGLRVSRKLLLDLNDIGLPLAMEMLDTITPQFLADLISWSVRRRCCALSLSEFESRACSSAAALAQVHLCLLPLLRSHRLLSIFRVLLQGRHWRSHDGESAASRVGVRTQHAHRIQERNRSASERARRRVASCDEREKTKEACTRAHTVGFAISCLRFFSVASGGSCKIATDAIVASRSPHSFLSVTSQGLAAIVETSGNPDCHLVLRGADVGPNYERKFVDEAVGALARVSAPLAVMIDASHGNSNKHHANQIKVVADVAAQLAQQNHPNSKHIVGVMVESNLVEGAQKLECGPGRKQQLKYGQSVTDACIAWDDTEKVLAMLAEGVQARRKIYAKEA